MSKKKQTIPDSITFDLEGSIKSLAFFALYAGLRMYKEQKEKTVAETMETGTLSLAAAEAGVLLEQLKTQFPAFYTDCEEEFNEVYG